MLYQPQKFDNLLGTPGFSDLLLKNHFTLYEGYVKNINKLVDDLKEAERGGWLGTPGYAELKRRFGWEWNGMRLHELYFGNMSKTPTRLEESKIPSKVEGTKKATLTEEINRVYGSYENWEKDFKAVGAMRGIGWTILYQDTVSKELFNVWVNEHDMGHLAGCKPMLVLDVFEHAYIGDYGLRRADYIEAFFRAIDWLVLEGRFDK
ncbi:MAG TPA: Fe-Mn family superoxide dismutase [Candidatus Paceibacterota bacterium]